MNSFLIIFPVKFSSFPLTMGNLGRERANDEKTLRINRDALFGHRTDQLFLAYVRDISN